MAWEARGDRRYFRRSVRDGRRVRSIYIGTGPVAELVAQADELLRAEREARRRARQAERDRLDEADAHLDRLDALADLLTRAELTAAGYHRHDRGAWRRRRGTQG